MFSIVITHILGLIIVEMVGPTLCFIPSRIPTQALPKPFVFNQSSSTSLETTTEMPLTKLHIGGLFPMTGTGGWLGGQGCQPAVEMALEDVNSRPDLLPGYYLSLTPNDSKCDSGLASALLYELVYEPPTKIMILGGCSIVCSTIAETAKMYNLVVFGYGSSSPALSNRSRFPTFFRTHPSATIHNPTRVKLFKEFKWQRIAIILEAEEVFVTTAKDLEYQCKKAGIEVLTRVTFLSDPSDAVKSLARQDARIIVGIFYGGEARKVMCEAYKQNLYGKQYVWFLLGWYEDNWYLPVKGLNCTKEEMLKVVQGHFTTEAIILNRDNKQTVAGITAQQWLDKYHQRLNQNLGTSVRPEGYQEAPLAYDAIWAVALALNATMHKLKKRGIAIESFNYENKLISQEIQNSLRDTFFLGVSGEVKFTDEGDRIALTQIEQMVNGNYNLLGYYDTQDDNLSWASAPQWLETGSPPKDRTVIVEQLKTVSLSFFVTLNAIAAIGIIWSIGLICFNFKFRKFRYIQMSQPLSNYIMLVGCIGCLSSVILFGLDSQKINARDFTKLCHSRAVLLSISFSLFFGAMFTKVWFAYRLSTQLEQSSKSKQKVENAQVVLMISLFCLIDVAILTSWFIKSPMIRITEKLEQEDVDPNDENIKVNFESLIVRRLERCDANLVWYCILFGYKGLLLLFGLFLAYETRSVKLKRLNDSRLVGMSIYNVVILCMITGPVSLVIVNHVDAHFAFITFTIIFCSG
uniref:G-protein coupled receptors family 3 profile domain-containing protein n=1 Tax=Tetranychus urticae TaxID=32264 RepID=T1KDL7_TETUR